MKTSLCANVQLNRSNFDFNLKSSIMPFFHWALQLAVEKGQRGGDNKNGAETGINEWVWKAESFDPHFFPLPLVGSIAVVVGSKDLVLFAQGMPP